MAVVPISRFPRDFQRLRRTSLKPVLLKAHVLLRRDVAAYIRDLPAQRRLSKLLGQDRRALLGRLVGVKHGATRYSVFLRYPRRKRDKLFFFGAKKLRSPREVYRLRRKAVRAGLFDERIMHLPPNVPPFSQDGNFFQQRCNPYRPGPSKRTVDAVAEDVLDHIVKTWGFR